MFRYIFGFLFMFMMLIIAFSLTDEIMDAYLDTLQDPFSVAVALLLSGLVIALSSNKVLGYFGIVPPEQKD